MFEIDFDHAHRDAVIDWLEAHHGELSVLVHPVTEDELADHTLHVAWLGPAQPLDLTKL
jgi:DOPA 4,5-dioxygenase